MILISLKGRLAEIPNASILVIEAGNSNDKIEGTQYAGGYVGLCDFV